MNLYLYLPPKLKSSPSQVSKGLRHLQEALRVPTTGVEGERERELVKRGKCVDDNFPKMEPVEHPQVGITFPGSSSVEILQNTEDNSVNFEGVPTRRLPSKGGSVRAAACRQGRLVRKCSKEEKNQPCRWFCRDKKRKTRQWS